MASSVSWRPGTHRDNAAQKLSVPLSVKLCTLQEDLEVTAIGGSVLFDALIKLLNGTRKHSKNLVL